MRNGGPLYLLTHKHDELNHVNTIHHSKVSPSMPTISLATASKTEDKVHGGLLLHVVVCQGTIIFQILSTKDQPLLIKKDSFLVQN